MIEIGGQSYAFSDPRVIAAAIGAAVLLLLIVLLFTAVRRAGRADRDEGERTGRCCRGGNGDRAPERG